MSDFSRQEVVSQLRATLPPDKPLYEIELPFQQPALEVVHFLRKRLRELPPGVVSVTGLATAFADDYPLADSLRVLNFHRDNLAQFPICQVWWMPRLFADTFLRSVPDLDSWFIIKLKLKEAKADGPTREVSMQETEYRLTDPNEAMKQSADYAERFKKAVMQEAPVEELVSLAGIAVNVLHNAGLEKKQDLSRELLNRLTEFFRRQGQTLEPTSPLFYATRNWMEEMGSDLFGLIGSFKAVAQLYESVGEINKAEDFFLAALKTAQDMANANALSQLQNVGSSLYSDLDYAYDLLVSFYLRHAQYAKAEVLCRQWISIQESTANVNEYHIIYGVIQLAKLYVLQRKYADAEALYCEMLFKCRSGDITDRQIEILMVRDIVDLYKRLGRHLEAEAIFRRAIKTQGAQ